MCTAYFSRRVLLLLYGLRSVRITMNFDRLASRADERFSSFLHANPSPPRSTHPGHAAKAAKHEAEHRGGVAVASPVNVEEMKSRMMDFGEKQYTAVTL